MQSVINPSNGCRNSNFSENIFPTKRVKTQLYLLDGTEPMQCWNFILPQGNIVHKKVVNNVYIFFIEFHVWATFRVSSLEAEVNCSRARISSYFQGRLCTRTSNNVHTVYTEFHVLVICRMSLLALGGYPRSAGISSFYKEDNIKSALPRSRGKP